MQKHVNLVDLVKSFPTNVFLQHLASKQQRTSLIKFDHWMKNQSEVCSISNLSTKVLGTGGMVYTMLFMLLRMFDKSYGMGGRFAAGVQAGGPVNLWSVNLKTLVLVAVLSTSYMAHFSAPKFYADFKDATVPRFNKVVATAFAIIVAWAANRRFKIFKV